MWSVRPRGPAADVRRRPLRVGRRAPATCRPARGRPRRMSRVPIHRDRCALVVDHDGEPDSCGLELAQQPRRVARGVLPPPITVTARERRVAAPSPGSLRRCRPGARSTSIEPDADAERASRSATSTVRSPASSLGTRRRDRRVGTATPPPTTSTITDRVGTAALRPRAALTPCSQHVAGQWMTWQNPTPTPSPSPSSGGSIPPHRRGDAGCRPAPTSRPASTGFLGSGWVRAGEGSDLWYMLYRFRDIPTLEAWEQSSQRAWWLESGRAFASEVRVERRTGIEGWFDAPFATHVETRTPAGDRRSDPFAADRRPVPSSSRSRPHRRDGSRPSRSGSGSSRRICWRRGCSDSCPDSPSGRSSLRVLLRDHRC